MSMATLKMTEDLLVAILLGDSTIERKGVKHILKFFLPPSKQKILKMYIDKSKLQTLIYIDAVPGENNLFIISNSLVLERIIRDWSDGENVIALDPRLLRNSTYMLWLCLFGNKVDNQVVIHQNTLTLNTKHSLIHFFGKTMGNSFLRLNSEGHFKVQALDELLLTSIIEHRPSYESLAILELLTDHAKKSFMLKQEKIEEEMREHACF